MKYTDEEGTLIAVQVIRNYKRFPFDITDEEIIDKYKLAIDRIKNSIQELEDNGGALGNISSIKNGNEEILFNKQGEYSLIDNVTRLLLGSPYVVLY